MADYKGKNNTKSLKFLFQERNRYYGTAYEDEEGDRKAGVFDMNSFESVFVGRMDPAMNAIFPNSNAIKYGSSLNVRGVNFAVDAFEAFRDEFHRGITVGAGVANFDTSHPFLSKITVYKSYEPPLNSYQTYIGALMQRMLQQIINRKHMDSIADFPSYVNYFLNFLKEKGPTLPFTRTGWQNSTNSNIFTSGLAFSIANLDCGDDAQKEEFFNNDSPNFNYYLQVAQDHGFVVSLHCPWIMIASPEQAQQANSQMGTFLANNNIINYKSVYNIIYNKLYLSDIDNLKNLLRLNYNQFVQRFPIRKKLCLYKCKTTRQNTTRTLIGSDQIQSYYSDLQFHILYAKIRNIEEDNVFDQAEFDRLEKNATFFYKNIDSSRSLSYINTQFRISYRQKSGGINDYLNKQAQIETDNSEE